MQKYPVVVVGGGCSGLTVAAGLKRLRPGLDVALIEPAENHYYQPAWTLVGAGVYSAEATPKAEAAIMSKGVTWTKAGVAGFEPKSNLVVLDDSTRIEYSYLVVAGIQLNWGAIVGLPETLGRNGVTSNHDYALAPYTWRASATSAVAVRSSPSPRCRSKARVRRKRFSTLPPTTFRRMQVSAELHFFTPSATMFGVPFFAQALDKVIEAWGATRNFGHNLVAVDGPSRRATFEVTEGNDKHQITFDFEMLHAVGFSGCRPSRQ